jgi:ribosome maturation factor RimP
LFEREFVKEDGMWFLRVSIEKDDGTMDFETAEVISNLVSDKLDELDPIEHEYVLDVCSPGAERPIRNKEEFLANLNEYISVYLDEEDENKKDMYTGDLLEVNDEDIVISYKDKTRVKKAKISFKNIIKAHIAIKF